MINILPPTSKRVRINTDSTVNYKIDQHINSRIERYKEASKSELTDRIGELDEEWDTERTLETSFASLVLLSTFLGFSVDKKWFTLGGIAAGFMLVHALEGWCPPLPLIRKLGIRTAEEIDGEKASLKILRGDYIALTNGSIRQ